MVLKMELDIVMLMIPIHFFISKLKIQTILSLNIYKITKIHLFNSYT
jgi:hypothetical protein